MNGYRRANLLKQQMVKVENYAPYMYVYAFLYLIVISKASDAL